ncbi:MAG: aminotransferase class I/II-fold pyridoxal phosphate-dependent enzyme [Thermoleophilaceae bacterium]
MTSGARQGLDLVARTVLGPGDVAVVESPTFIGVLSSLEATGARVIGVPVDEDGFDVDSLERVLARHEVKLCALQTGCQNPTGRDLAPERRDAAGRAGPRALLLHPRGRRVRQPALRGRGPRPPAQPRAVAGHLRRLAVEDHRRRPARGVDRRARTGLLAPRHC